MGTLMRRRRGLSARLDHDFDFATLSSISGYRKNVQDYSKLDGDLTPLPLVIVFPDTDDLFV